MSLPLARSGASRPWPRGGRPRAASCEADPQVLQLGDRRRDGGVRVRGELDGRAVGLLREWAPSALPAPPARSPPASEVPVRGSSSITSSSMPTDQAQPVASARPTRHQARATRGPPRSRRGRRAPRRPARRTAPGAGAGRRAPPRAIARRQVGRRSPRSPRRRRRGRAPGAQPGPERSTAWWWNVLTAATPARRRPRHRGAALDRTSGCSCGRERSGGGRSSRR